MHDLDVERRERREEREKEVGERGFTFGGESFVHVQDCPYDVIRQAAKIEEERNGLAVIEGLEQVAIALIEPGEELAQVEGEEAEYEAHYRFRELVKRRIDPITLQDLSGLVKWLLEATSARPTVPPSGSPDGSQPSGTGSTVSSSSPPAGVSVL